MFTVEIQIELKSKRKASSSSLSSISTVGIGRRCIFLLLIMIVGSGCESLKLDGFSAGIAILNTDVTTITTNELGNYGELTTKQNTKVNELMPIFLLNFKFE